MLSYIRREEAVGGWVGGGLARVSIQRQNTAEEHLSYQSVHLHCGSALTEAASRRRFGISGVFFSLLANHTFSLYIHTCSIFSIGRQDRVCMSHSFLILSGM